MAALSGLTAQQLRDEWRRLYRGQPPRLSRDLLIRSIAYRMQELSHGGLSKATQRTLATLSKEFEANGNISVAPDLRGQGIGSLLDTSPQLKAVICNSEMVRNEITARFGTPGDKLVLIRNAVDADAFHPGLRDEMRAAVRQQVKIPAEVNVAFVRMQYGAIRVVTFAGPTRRFRRRG